MNKLKLGLIVLTIMLLCGCSAEEKYKDTKYSTDELFVDKETCIEYFRNYTYGGYYVITPRYDENGMVKINEQCLKNKK